MSKKIQIRQGTAAEWAAENPILASGELGYDSTNKSLKIGDGVTAWNSLLDFVKEARIAEQIAQGVYAGTNLEEKFAAEIAGYDNVAAWLHARCQAGNFTGIYPFDYFYDQCSAGTVATKSVAATNRKCIIAGINLYKDCGDQSPVMPNHLTIWAGLTAETVEYNAENNNNGSASEPCPYRASKLFAVLNGVNNADSNPIGNVGYDASSGGYLQLFSAALQAIMVEQRVYMGKRYSSSGALIEDNGQQWENRGKLFAPSEIEAYGCLIHSNRENEQAGNSEGYGPYCQWPIFKSAGKNGRLLSGRTTYWLSSVAGGSSSIACGVGNNGFASCHNTSSTAIRAPLAFHIA